MSREKSLKRALLVVAVATMVLCGRADAGVVNFTLPLDAPQLEKITTEIAAPGGAVPVTLALGYDEKGKLICLPGSTVDGVAVAGQGTQKNSKGLWSYSVAAKTSAQPTASVSVSGPVGAGGATTAKCTYQGPKGKITVPANAIILDIAAVAADVMIDAAIDIKGKITGTGTIVSGYGNDSSEAGVLKGSLKKDRISWSLKQGRQKLSFKGLVAGSDWTGDLKVDLRPEKRTVEGFTMRAAVVAAAGLATFKGSVTLDYDEVPLGNPTPASGVLVTIRCDKNGDGAFSSSESVSVETDSDGEFQQAFEIFSGSPVMIDFSYEGFVGATRVFPSVVPSSTVVTAVSLKELEDLDVLDGKARSSDGRLAMQDLPSNVRSLGARVFNPAYEADSFPGEFAESNGALLVSSVFCALEAKDSSGRPVKNLTTESTLKMQVPADTFGTMKDLHPGTGQIDVPLYYFDDASGEWRRSTSDGWLVDSSDAKIPEASLPSIQNGTYSGSIWAVGPVTHLSYWNVDWPVDTHQCITGNVVEDVTNDPLPGAVVSVRGITYSGTTSPKTTDIEGLFCADVMRSEPIGEDIDGDGTPGETHQVEILVYWGGEYYQFGPYSLPETAATCDSGGCFDVGDLVLSEANRIEVSICTFQGKVVYSGVAYRGTSPLSVGDPVPDAFVWGYDEEAWNDAAATDCFVAGTCTLYDLADALGDYSLTAPILTGIDLEAWLAATSADPHEVAYYMGAAPVRGCPVGPVTIPVDYWSIWVLTADMQSAGGDVDGSFVVIDTVANCFFTAGSNFYLAVSSSVPAAPVPPADWFTMDLTRISSTGSISPRGTLSLRIEEASPEGYFRGTWTTSTAGFSGTWQEFEYPTALRTPGFRGKGFVKEALKRVTSALPR